MIDHDSVSLHVSGRVLSHFTSYTFTKELYTPDSSFSFSASRPDFEIPTGVLCLLKINDIPVLTGVIDAADPEYDKHGIGFSVVGRDLMGLVVDEYVKTFKTYKSATLRTVAEDLLRDVPFISNKNIKFLDNTDKINLKEKNTIQTEPSQTVYDVLRDIAVARGVVFYCDSDGSFTFASPLVQPTSVDYSFSIKKTSSGRYVNNSKILSGKRVKNRARHYRNIKIYGQSDDDLTLQKNIQDDTAPINNTLVVIKDDNSTLDYYAQNLVAQQRFRAFSLLYTCSGHSQNGKVFKTNAFASVDDAVCNCYGNFLIYNATYALSRQSGINTALTLSHPGVII